jgi:hypothetical protein
MTATLTPGGVLADVLVGGRPLPEFTRADVIESPGLDMGVDQVSQLDFMLSDPDLPGLIASGALNLRGEVRYLDLRFEVAAYQTGGGTGYPEVRVEARSAGAQAMRRAKGALVYSNVSPTQFVEHLAAEVGGLAFLGEPSAARPQVTRAAAEGEEPESSWDCGQRLARELGYLAFEAGGIYHFGRPTWLVGQGFKWKVRWPGVAASDELEPVSVPSCRRSADSPDAASISLELPYPTAALVRPGHVLELRGMTTFDGVYLVVGVRFSLDGVSHVSVEAATPVDPAPEPPPEPPVHDEAEEAYAEPAEGDPTGGGESEDGWIWPVSGRITSRFGAARPGGRRHAGLDIAASTGTRVAAGRFGAVSFAGWAGGYGNVVYVNHDGGEQSRYAHLSRISVGRGAHVARGQVVGYVGATGAATGPHLHFEIRRGGVAVNPEGPLP